MQLTRQCPRCERVEDIDLELLRRGKLPRLRCAECKPARDADDDEREREGEGKTPGQIVSVDPIVSLFFALPILENGG